jgi:hypothetical protein
MVAGQVAGVTDTAVGLGCGCLSWPRAGIKASRLVAVAVRSREPVVRVGPGCCLHGIRTGRADALGKLGQLVPTPLADCGKRHRVPGQIERDLVRLASPISAAHCLDGQHGTINAAQRPHNGTLTSRCPKATPPAPQLYRQGVTRHVATRITQVCPIAGMPRARGAVRGWGVTAARAAANPHS